MNPLLSDPIVLISGGAILVGLIGLVWSMGVWRRMAKVPEPAAGDILSQAAEARGFDLGPLPQRVVTPPPTPTAAPPISRDVAERLDSMTQRLAEMQSVLLKSSAAAAPEAGAPPGGVGQGFSPETIDKLLKIIGNVVQQVDILQKSLNPAKEGAAKVESGVPPLSKI